MAKGDGINVTCKMLDQKKRLRHRKSNLFRLQRTSSATLPDHHWLHGCRRSTEIMATKAEIDERRTFKAAT
jgi:hypothetical protein